MGRRVILRLRTPPTGGAGAVTSMGAAARRTCMSIAHHDEALAATSHLPHMLALPGDTLARMDENDEIFRYAAGGFRDFTRIASSNPDVARYLCRQ